MSQEPDVTRVFEEMSRRAHSEHLPDPVTLRAAAVDRQHRRRRTVAAACTAALVLLPLTVAVARQDRSAPPASPPVLDCLAATHGPRSADWSGDALNKPGWGETFPVVPPHHKVEFTSVAANPTGYLVLGRTYAGNFGRTFHDEQAKAWFSTNGRTWTVSRPPSGVGDGLLAMGGVFYANGFAEDGSPALWATTDGRTWRSTTIVHLPQRLDRWVGKLVSLDRLRCEGGRLFAYGTDHNTWAGWGTTDGRHWSRINLDDPVHSSLHVWDLPSLAGVGPAGTVAISAWGDGWTPARIWLHRV
jgi:hypothetical protein